MFNNLREERILTPVLDNNKKHTCEVTIPDVLQKRAVNNNQQSLYTLMNKSDSLSFVLAPREASFFEIIFGGDKGVIEQKKWANVSFKDSALNEIYRLLSAKDINSKKAAKIFNEESTNEFLSRVLNLFIKDCKQGNYYTALSDSFDKSDQLREQLLKFFDYKFSKQGVFKCPEFVAAVKDKINTLTKENMLSFILGDAKSLSEILNGKLNVILSDNEIGKLAQLYLEYKKAKKNYHQDRISDFFSLAKKKFLAILGMDIDEVANIGLPEDYDKKGLKSFCSKYKIDADNLNLIRKHKEELIERTARYRHARSLLSKRNDKIDKRFSLYWGFHTVVSNMFSIPAFTYMNSSITFGQSFRKLITIGMAAISGKLLNMGSQLIAGLFVKDNNIKFFAGLGGNLVAGSLFMYLANTKKRIGKFFRRFMGSIVYGDSHKNMRDSKQGLAYFAASFLGSSFDSFSNINNIKNENTNSILKFLPYLLIKIGPGFLISRNRHVVELVNNTSDKLGKMFASDGKRTVKRNNLGLV